jgi:predicted metal-dependent hydrolase
MKLHDNRLSIIRRPVKHARLRVREDETVELIAPNDFSDAEIENILARKTDWIEKQQVYFRESPRDVTELGPNEFQLFGQVYRWQMSAKLGRKVIVDNVNRVVCSGSKLNSGVDRESWYRAFATEHLVRRTAELAQLHKFRFGRVYVRAQQTKWGSCSSKKNISLNWRLVMAPEFVIDYVILHELMHTRVMDHSQRFWVSLAAMCSDYEEAIAWLRRNRPETCTLNDEPTAMWNGRGKGKKK